MEEQLKELQREIRKLNRENTHLKNAIAQEKIAYTTVLNQQKASTFIQRERERYLALLLANSPSIILFLSHTGRVEFCTDYFIEIAKINNSLGILGHTLSEVLQPFMDSSTHAELLLHTKNVAESNVPLSFDVDFYFGADILNFAGLIVPMKDEGQERTGILLLFHDVTGLQRSREEALAASKAKSSFLSNMSHEIRTPMNAIIGMTTIGKNEETLAGKNNALDKIETASTHLLGIINDILDISKIESGKMELSVVDFNFNEMIDKVISVTYFRVQDKNQNLSIHIDPAIPPFLHGDDQCIVQVLTNILHNATKFTPENGDISLTARFIETVDNKCRLRISVKDSGIGMTKEEQSKLFSIFQQAEAGTSRKFGGSGLGLAISKRLLEMMDGEIWVDSEKGHGSEFSFEVKLKIADGSNVEKQSSDLNYDMSFVGKTILAVDDVDINLEIVDALLEPTGVEIVTASSGKEAVSLFTEDPNRFDLIFMDMQMPEIDGTMATQMIRAFDNPRAKTIPIIAMTANVFKEDIDKCLAAGMNGHLGKPIDMEEILKVLANELL